MNSLDWARHGVKRVDTWLWGSMPDTFTTCQSRSDRYRCRSANSLKNMKPSGESDHRRTTLDALKMKPSQPRTGFALRFPHKRPLRVLMLSRASIPMACSSGGSFLASPELPIIEAICRFPPHQSLRRLAWRGTLDKVYDTSYRRRHRSFHRVEAFHRTNHIRFGNILRQQMC